MNRPPRQISKINNRLADSMADWLANMVMFWGVTALVISILFFQTPKTPLDWVQYLVQTFFQGVALPVLAFVSKKEGAKTHRLLKETHDAVIAELQLLKSHIQGEIP